VFFCSAWRLFIKVACSFDWPTATAVVQSLFSFRLFVGLKKNRKNQKKKTKTPKNSLFIFKKTRWRKNTKVEKQP